MLEGGGPYREQDRPALLLREPCVQPLDHLPVATHGLAHVHCDDGPHGRACLAMRPHAIKRV
jgi:hypothetical protein